MRTRGGIACQFCFPASLMAGGWLTLTLCVPHGDAVRMTPGTATDRHNLAHSFALEHASSETLHPAHARANTRVELPYAHCVEQPELRPHHVLHGQDGKSGGISFLLLFPLALGERIQRAGSSRTIASSYDIGADDKVLVRVKRRPWSDELFPPSGFGVLLCTFRVAAGAESSM